MRIACGTDAPAIPHGQNAKELCALVDRGMTPMQALRAATITSAELIEADDELGRLAPGYLADIIAVPGDPSRRHRHHAGRAVRDEGRRGLQAADVETAERSASMEQTDNILWLLKQAWYFSLTTVNEAVSEHGVSTAQIGMLRQLATEPGLSGADLARRLLISPQGVQLALKELERRGLVERKQDPQHGRILQAFLTDQGRKVAEAVVSDAIAAHDEGLRRAQQRRAGNAA